MAESNWTVWDVKGTFVIPGSRDKASFSLRVGDRTRKEASAHLAEVLNDKFAKKLRDEHKFNRDFAMLNLQWEEYSKPRKVEASNE